MDIEQSEQLKSNPVESDTAILLINLGITLSLFGLLAGGFYFWSERSFIISPSFLYTLFFSSAPLGLGLYLFFKKNSFSSWKKIRLSPSISCFGLALVFFSDWLTRGFNLFQGPSIRGELIISFILLIIFIKKISARGILLFAVASCFIGFCNFLYRSNGHPIISDDHSSFIFRLTLLKEHFPNIPIYFPWWNAGLDARDFFATGAIGFFLLTAPLHYLLDLSISYNLAVGLVTFVILPLSLGYAAKLAKIEAPGPAIAGILGLATSLVIYRWSLKYGTMGFVTSAALMPTVFMLASYLINNQKLSSKQLLSFLILISIACMWPLGGVCYLALLALSLFRFPKLIRNKQILISIIVLIAINLPWAAMLWKVSKVGNFIKSPTSSSYSSANQESENSKNTVFRHKSSNLDFKKALKVVREQANGTNPIILFLSLPGLFLLSSVARKGILIQSLILLIGGSILVSIRPQLELDRLLVFLSILLVIPSTKALVELYINREKTILASSLAFSFLVLTPWISTSIVDNRSAENYHFESNNSDRFIEALSSSLTSGRAVFSGFVLHEFDGGHVAPLATWIKKPLVASSPFHNRWKYTDVIPNKFLEKGDAGVEEFMELMNAELILAHESHWRSYLKERPNKYEELWSEKPFNIFKRKNFKSNYFLTGKGSLISQSSNSVIFSLETEDAILKFNYFDFLRVEGCELTAYDVGLDFPFIELKNCPINKQLELKSVGPIERLMQ